MDKYAEELFKNSNKESDVPEEIIEKYRDKVSEEIIDMWRNFGFCSTEEGYYKVVNPDDYEEIIKDIYDCENDPIVIFATGMADMIVYEDGYFFYVDVRHQRYGGAGKNLFIMMDTMREVDFKESELSWEPYEEAVKIYGIPGYKECFAYEPLLSLGGNENVENMKKVNLQVHLNIVSQLQDIISF